MPVIRTNLEYKYPLKYNEIGLIETTFVNSRAAKLIFRFEIYDENRTQLKVKGETVQVFTNADNVLQLHTPPFFEEWKHKKSLV